MRLRRARKTEHDKQYRAKERTVVETPELQSVRRRRALRELHGAALVPALLALPGRNTELRARC